MDKLPKGTKVTLNNLPPLLDRFNNIEAEAAGWLGVSGDTQLFDVAATDGRSGVFATEDQFTLID